ncbi:MAG TPA: tRNA pseudouridine(55) synthase TruB [Candidatus Saccharimonadales bacterium]
MDGVLLVDKPAGWTSHDAVAKVRSIIRAKTGRKVKVGHTGTLDPFATGLLIIVIGSYTKRAAEFSRLDKTYEAELTLGASSTTGDIDGEISPKSTKKPAEAELRAVLRQFEGQIEQTPHQYSAVKVGGQRAYKMARQGKEVKLEPRKVRVYRLEVLGYRYPKLKILAEVSSGTYIRSLAEDIGEKLGTGAYLSVLHRTKVGNFNLKDAQDMENLDIEIRL